MERYGTRNPRTGLIEGFTVLSNLPREWVLDRIYSAAWGFNPTDCRIVELTFTRASPETEEDNVGVKVAPYWTVDGNRMPETTPRSGTHYNIVAGHTAPSSAMITRQSFTVLADETFHNCLIGAVAAIKANHGISGLRPEEELREAALSGIRDPHSLRH